MRTIQFRGWLYPLSFPVTTGPWRVTWSENPSSPPIRFTIKVVDSKVTVDCEVETFDTSSDQSLIWTRALEVTRAVVDPIAFLEGVGLTVQLEQLVTPDGIILETLTHIKALRGIATAFEDDIVAVQMLCLGDPRLHLALNDLIVAIAVPGQITINCARAIEGLRHLMMPENDPTRKLGWLFMQEELNISRNYREFINKNSTGHRHGEQHLIEGSIVQEALVRSWVIFNRYIEYRKRGGQRLSDPEFPLLI